MMGGFLSLIYGRTGNGAAVDRSLCLRQDEPEGQVDEQAGATG